MRSIDAGRSGSLDPNDIGRSATIFIVDDQESNLRVLERVLSNAGYTSFVSTTDPLKAVELFIQYKPDLVVLDLHMPQLDGLGVLEQLNAHVPADAYVPVLVLTGDLSPTSKQRALSAGAKDFLGKPFDPLEVVLRIKNLLEARSLYLTLQRQNDVLEDKVAQRRRELEDAQLEILERLGRTAEFRDDDTMQHTQRVGAISARIAEVLGLPPTLARTLRLAAPLHDVGKIGVPDNILLKLGKLTQDEYDVIKAHTAIGARILSGKLTSAAADGGTDRADPSRTLGRQRISPGPERRSHPARQPHRRRGRCLRRADAPAALQGPVAGRRSAPGDRESGGAAVRPRRRRRVAPGGRG